MKRLRDLTAVLGMVALNACNNASIEGSWVEPVPGMPRMQQGFVLDGDGSASSINMATLKSVSYTHLDVYKRQPVYSAFLPRNIYFL